MSSIAANPKSRLPVAEPARGARSAGSPNIASSNRAMQFLTSTLGLGLTGSLLMFLALPPCDLWPLAWLAPIPWLLLVRQPKLDGRRPYFKLWLAGFVFWLAAIYWLLLPHWTTTFGWLALSFYLAFYLPVFVGLCRVAVQSMRISVVLAAPIVFTGLELARGHLLSGFTMGALSHTQIHWLSVIQIADIVGDYGVSGLVMFVAACIARMIPWRQGSGFGIQGSREQESGRPTSSLAPSTASSLWPSVPLVAVLAAALIYGHLRLSGEHFLPGPKVALIQGAFNPQLGSDEDMRSVVFNEYFTESQKALAKAPHIDLMVWPETMYPDGLMEVAPNFQPAEEWKIPPADAAVLRLQALVELQHRFQSVVEDAYGAPLPPPLLLGMDAVHLANDRVQHFNSALFIDSQGKPLSRYDKMHPVMFGEYIPLAEYLPFLYKITPLTGGLTPGAKAVAQKLGAVRFAPDVCYETVIPHLIRTQVLQLRARGEEPDVLVNVTNDGWFRGSSELDMHLACGVMRAIEMRKPLVIAANTGFSAYVDGDGRMVEKAPRGRADSLIADVALDTRRSFYLDHGDWFSGLCLAACGVLAIVGIWTRRASKRMKIAKQSD